MTVLHVGDCLDESHRCPCGGALRVMSTDEFAWRRERDQTGLFVSVQCTTCARRYAYSPADNEIVE